MNLKPNKYIALSLSDSYVTWLEKRITELEGAIGLERIDTHNMQKRLKGLEHQEWLLKMELEGYQELCRVQEFIIDELKVAQSTQ